MLQIPENTVVMDLETLRSARECLHCGVPREGDWETPADHEHENIGWRNFAALSLAIGCYYDYSDAAHHYFDVHTLGQTMKHLVDRQCLMVSFNGIQFDFPLMRCVFPNTDDPILHEWDTLCAQSYDILAEIWRADPQNKFQRGNGLNALSLANGGTQKLMDGATAPLLWKAGRVAEVIEYVTDDVRKTNDLFERICLGLPIERAAGALVLPMPVWPQEKSDD